MIVLLSDISSFLSVSPDYDFFKKFPTFRLNSKFSPDIQRSILSLKLLSIGLEHYGIKLIDESFSYNQYGKPSISAPKIHFSISHSGKYIVCALSEKNIGVDIQQNIDDFSDVIDSLNSHESEYLKTLTNKNELTKNFFNIWTIKESYLKMIGTGLYKDLNSFYVSLDTHQLFDDLPVKEVDYRCFSVGDTYTLSVVFNQSEELSIKYVKLEEHLLPPTIPSNIKQ
ncbi:4'-phosphopantetheinyl transferase family protein [Lactococcus lactis]|uniref:4'-phosphopantetheinyl transferase family protein n=1 Tax=Lactococcus lactis TaxID=1358 RepID=UPI00117B135D|nr:4'-phosphopantetheinyl transferase superfamily protein [Lactococcus lactis]TRW68976.1 4'-phosphopantetheinyl transferase superfamily protein [Lactococcus lactis]